MIRCDEENVALLFTFFVYISNCLVCSCYGFDRSFIHTGMSHHVRGSKIIHYKLISVLRNAFTEFIGDRQCAHFRLQIIRRNLGGWNHVADLTRELLLHPAVEEEGDMGVFLCLGDVTLLDVFGAEILGQHVAHMLWAKCDWEGVVKFVLCHCCDGDIFGIREVGLGASVGAAKELSDFANTI